MNLPKSERTTPSFQPRHPEASSADSINERPIRLTAWLNRRDWRYPGLSRKAPWILLLLLGGLCWMAMEARRPAAVRADEGMWTFDNPPLRQWRENYGFTPDQAWLDRLRLATVRLSEGAGGGTGCLVSPQGLLMTNQHVGRGQVSKLSSGGRDLVRDGFYAASEAEELKCPDLEVNVLVSFEEVTARVEAAVQAAADESEVTRLRRAAIAEIERESVARTGLKSEVVVLYNGGEYWLYRFKRYTDVRLVFAPEEQIAYFGGDDDNFTYPRYCLDVTFFRLYEDGKPAATPDHFRWSEKGPVEGELVVVPGFPGSTARLLTVAQLRYQRDVGNPLQRLVWTARRDALLRYAARGDEARRQSSAARLALDNSLKRLVGQQAGLENPRIFARKEEEETRLRTAVAGRPDWQQQFGPAWSAIEAAYRDLPAMAPRLAFSNLAASRLSGMASTLVRYAEEVAKPNAARAEEFRDNRLESLRATLLSRAPLYPEMEEALLADWLQTVQTQLGPNDPFVQAALGEANPPEVAQSAIRQTRLHDPAFRQSLLAGDPSAILQSEDPLLRLAKRVEPTQRELRDWQSRRLQAIETAAGQKIARARFAVYGRSVYPDANFQLRITYGTVAGYEAGTTQVPWRTTFFGLLDRALGFAEKPPFQLPPRYRTLLAPAVRTGASPTLDLATPFNFVYTADTIGGNSGSPVVNRQGELVGINFDSNLQKLPNRYLYVEASEGSRAVGVHSRAIVAALTSIYQAESLVREITPRPGRRATP